MDRNAQTDTSVRGLHKTSIVSATVERKGEVGLLRVGIKKQYFDCQRVSTKIATGHADW